MSLPDSWLPTVYLVLTHSRRRWKRSRARKTRARTTQADAKRMLCAALPGVRTLAGYLVGRGGEGAATVERFTDDVL